MGYSVWPELKVEGCELSALLKETLPSDNTPLSDIFDEDGDPYDWLKWYDREQDMAKVSERFPEALITLKIQGEAYEDISIEYYRNGRSEVYQADILFPPPTV